MEGSYGNVFSNMSSSSPNTPGGSSSGEKFKANVNRAKTKKWVEAKTQNYAGDDWGNDFDEAVEEEEPVARPPPPTAPVVLPQSSFSTAVRPAGSPRPGAASGNLPGPPPLYIPTATSRLPTAPDTVSPFTLGSALERPAAHETIVSPQSITAAFSPATQRRMSPAPQSGGPAPARFPPRKSSIGQQDYPDPWETVRQSSRPSSRPGSSQSHTKPWVEGRPASPGGLRSAGGSTPKVLPFIRPADIYKRMEEEKEKERLSLEGSRPSMDSLGGRPGDRSDSPSKNIVHPIVPAPATVAKEDTLGKSSLTSSLSPVAEGKGDSPQSTTLPQTEDDTKTKSAERDLDAQEDVRRFSASPKLPDVARMSAFGDDLFSNPSRLFQDAPPMPAIPDAAEIPSPPDAASPKNGHAVDEAQKPESETASVEPLSEQAIPVPSPATGQHSSADAPEDSDRTSIAAPSTPADLQDVPTDPQVNAPVDVSVDNQNVSRLGVRDESHGDTESATAEPAVSDSDASGRTDATERSRLNEPTPSAQRVASPLAPPPLKTSAPASQVDAEAPVMSKDSSEAPSTASTSEITPTAPLNPRRSGALPQDFVAPHGPLERLSTMSTVTSQSPVKDSPMKESDKLREEIIKTLSPVKSPGGGYPIPSVDTVGSSSATTAGSTHQKAGRESSYLGDVYDDYWSQSEDQPGPETAAADRDEEEPDQKAPQDTPLPATPSPHDETLGVSTVPDPEGRPLRKRFSWESGGDEDDNGPVKTDSTERLSPSGDQSQEEPVADDPAPLPMQFPPEAGDVALAAHLSQAEATPPQAPGTPAEFNQPSPGIASPETPAPTQIDEPRRLSLAEEKGLIQTSSNPVSPSPPRDQHPALEKSAGSTPTSTTPSGPRSEAVNLMAFRNIMNIQNTSERIRMYNETRARFASIDSGLDQWIAGLRTSQPEHAYVTTAFNSAPTAGPLSPGDPQPGPQPFAATSPPASGPSEFRHSSNQMGAKGKEFLMAAGKAGKGLLSKGKNKLRGTGDKVFF